VTPSGLAEPVVKFELVEPELAGVEAELVAVQPECLEAGLERHGRSLCRDSVEIGSNYSKIRQTTTNPNLLKVLE